MSEIDAMRRLAGSGGASRGAAPDPHDHCDHDGVECTVQALEGELAQWRDRCRRLEGALEDVARIEWGGLEVQLGDLLVLRGPEPPLEFIESLVTTLRQLCEDRGQPTPLVVILPEHTAIELVPEERLRETGWVRAPRGEEVPGGDLPVG